MLDDLREARLGAIGKQMTTMIFATQSLASARLVGLDTLLLRRAPMDLSVSWDLLYITSFFFFTLTPFGLT